MFGNRRSTTIDRNGLHLRDRGHDAGMNRDNRGVSPIMGGIAGTVLQNFVARKLAGRFAARAGGIPGLIIGAGITYAVNRMFNGRRGTRRF
jgi:outer membrane lipoprotein SlyB